MINVSKIIGSFREDNEPEKKKKEKKRKKNGILWRLAQLVVVSYRSGTGVWGSVLYFRQRRRCAGRKGNSGESLLRALDGNASAVNLFGHRGNFRRLGPIMKQVETLGWQRRRRGTPTADPNTNNLGSREGIIRLRTKKGFGVTLRRGGGFAVRFIGAKQKIIFAADRWGRFEPDRKLEKT